VKVPSLESRATAAPALRRAPRPASGWPIVGFLTTPGIRDDGWRDKAPRGRGARAARPIGLRARAGGLALEARRRV